jgi:hypothetical protein
VRATLAVVPDAPYRGPLPPDPYMAGWAAVRRRRRVSAIAMGWATALGVCPFAIGSAIEQLQPGVVGLAVGLLLAAALLSSVATLYRASAPCPRCRKWFDGPRYGSPDRRLCAHCGIPFGTPKSVIDETARRAAPPTDLAAGVARCRVAEAQADATGVEAVIEADAVDDASQVAEAVAVDDEHAADDASHARGGD